MIIVIKIHSIVDAITNSSSELFVVDTTHVDKFVKEIFDFFAEKKYIKVTSWNDFELSRDSIRDRGSARKCYNIPDDADTTNTYVIVCKGQDINAFTNFLEENFTILYCNT